MPKLAPLSSREVVRKLSKLGYEGPISGGKHVRMVKISKKKIIPIPMHGNRDISVGLIKEIIREAGIDRETWLKL